MNNLIKNIINFLKVGDIVFEKEPHFFENDFHPQQIEDIDINNNKIKVYEKPLNKRQWLNECFIFNKKTKKIDFYG